MTRMQVLVVGASGPLGRKITLAALNEGHEVTALVRDPARFDMRHERLTTATGDVLDDRTLNAPMAGKNAVICSLGVKPTWKPVTLFTEGTSNVLRCMQRHNARRFICITGIGAGNSKGHGGFLYDKIIQPLLLKTIYEDKTRLEEQLPLCDRDWLVVRPARLTDGLAKGRYWVFRKNFRGVRANRISRADVAAFVVKQLTSNKYLYDFVVLTD